MLWLSQTLNLHAPMLLGILLTLGVALFWAFQQGYVGRAASACMQAIGPLRRQVNEFRLAKLYQSMALMVRGGYAVAESLEQCAELELGPGMRARLLQARAELEQGKRISTALSNAQMTDTVTARLLAIAERTGNFDQVLQTVSLRHASTFITFIERATRVVEPLMLLAASLLVGSVVVMMYMPVFDIASSIK
jgi:general secretion pathway protein F